MIYRMVQKQPNKFDSFWMNVLLKVNAESSVILYSRYDRIGKFNRVHLCLRQISYEAKLLQILEESKYMDTSYKIRITLLTIRQLNRILEMLDTDYDSKWRSRRCCWNRRWLWTYVCVIVSMRDKVCIFYICKENTKAISKCEVFRCTVVHFNHHH